MSTKYDLGKTATLAQKRTEQLARIVVRSWFDSLEDENEKRFRQKSLYVYETRLTFEADGVIMYVTVELKFNESIQNGIATVVSGKVMITSTFGNYSYSIVTGKDRYLLLLPENDLSRKTILMSMSLDQYFFINPQEKNLLKAIIGNYL